MPEFLVDKDKPVKNFIDQRLYTHMDGQWFEIRQRPSPDEGIPRPPREVFKRGNVTVTEHLVQGSPQPLPYITKYEYPSEEEGGGMFIHYLDFKYPRKGFPFPEAVQANNIAKRMLIGQIRWLAKNPLAAISLLKRKNLDKWLQEMSSACNISLGQFHLLPFRYQKSLRELRKLVEAFLKEIGINQVTSEEFAEVVASMLEWDDAYALYLGDLLTETTKEKLMKDPGGEIARLLAIYKQRDSRAKMHETFGSSAKLLRLAFMYPGIKKAFRKALKEVNFEVMQFDDNDRYNTLRWIHYDFMGKSFEDRVNEFMKIHEGKHPRMLIMEHK